jgi:hypothetical protein
MQHTSAGDSLLSSQGRLGTSSVSGEMNSTSEMCSKPGRARSTWSTRAMKIGGAVLHVLRIARTKLSAVCRWLKVTAVQIATRDMIDPAI